MKTISVVVAVLLACIALTAQPVINVQSLGARANGTDAAITTAAFATALENSDAVVIVPAGTYAINNPLTITGFSGQLIFDDAAQMVFQSNEAAGIIFTGGTGAKIQNPRSTYATPPATAGSGNEWQFNSTTNTTLIAPQVLNSPLMGIAFLESINPVVRFATITNTMADGLNFSNCQNPYSIGLRTTNTGDDGLSFVSYMLYPNLSGGLAENSSITNSKARGIAVAGQSGVTVNGFQIHGTSSSGVLVDQDMTYNTYVPSNVLIENGTISTVGGVSPLRGNQYGIEYNGQVSAEFRNILVYGSAGPGMAGQSASGAVTAINVTVENPGTGDGFNFYQTGSVSVSGITSINTPSYGAAFIQSGKVAATNVTAINAGTTDPLKRAIWFEGVTSISASVLNVTAAMGDANIVGCYNDPGYTATGWVRLINPQIAGGTLSLQNNCPLVTMVQ